MLNKVLKISVIWGYFHIILEYSLFPPKNMLIYSHYLNHPVHYLIDYYHRLYCINHPARTTLFPLTNNAFHPIYDL